MWSLRLNEEEGRFCLTYDRNRRHTEALRGVWEFIGLQSNENTLPIARANQANGYLCCEDDEGGVRVLILTE